MEGGLVEFEFQNKTYFGSIVLEPSKYKCGSHNHFLCLHKEAEFHIDAYLSSTVF